MYKVEKITGLINFISIIFISYSPLYIQNSNNIMYAYGPSVNILTTICTIYSILVIFIVAKNIRKLKSKKYIPLYVFIIMIIILLIIRSINPGLLLSSAILVYIDMIMYHTIENPDMYLLKEMHDAKLISDNANEEKTLFLYNMTQEIRKTTNTIDNEANIILESESLNVDKDCARNIKSETATFNSMTNDILDVSRIDSVTIKVYNNKYDLKLILKEIINKYNKIIKSKKLEFRTNIEHNIPDFLYGDSIGLKSIITKLLDNSIYNTKKGYIEFNVNTIIKNDICRLIINIEDSGIGIKSEELNQVKINNSNISESYKKIILMNGTMILSSDYGIGTKIKIIIDQKLETNSIKEIKEYKMKYMIKEDCYC